MTIIWYGQSFFEIKTRDNLKEEVKITIDPFDESLGLKVPKVRADILLITHSHYDHSNKKAILGEPFLIEEPGEYEVKGVFVKGIPSFHDNLEGKERGTNVIYKIEAEEMKICHLGDLGQKELKEEQIEEIGQIDILMIPVGGTYTIGSKEAAAVISQIEPKIVIPMHYKIPKLKLNIEGPEKFLKIMGVEKIESQKKLKISLRDLPKEETEIVLLEP
ncbi:MAG: MBL fold metallo-hydrolase [Patescibacteria group bacterium]|nr:MBL fold metallo-hydrolase [Patescibacteria group bacterium]